MGDLELKAAGDEFAAVPEAAGGLHGQDVDGARKKADDPAGDPIQPEEAVWRAISLHVNKLKSRIFFISNRVPEGSLRRIKSLYMKSASLVRF
jgi:hypothetical protein